MAEESAEAERVPGEVEVSVREALDSLAIPTASRYLAKSAVVIARAVDSYSATAESAAQLSAIVKANLELRQTMGAIQRAAASAETADEAADDVDALSTPGG